MGQGIYKMRLQQTAFNILLALVLALPLTALESRTSYHVIGSFALSSHQPKEEAPVKLGLRESSSGLVHLVFDKLEDDFELNARAERYDDFITNIATDNGVSPALVKAVIQAESNFNPSAVSSSGAVGLMQVLPATARRMGVSDPADPHSNITAGVKYLKLLLEMFDNDESLALAAYNSGPARVEQYGGVPLTRKPRLLSRKS